MAHVKTVLQLVRGAALGGLLTGAALALFLIAGLAPGAGRLLFVGVGIAALAFVLIEEQSSHATPVGSMVVALLGIIGGLATGWGWLATALVTGGVAGAAWLALGRRIDRFPAPRWAVAILAVVVAALVPLVVGGETLGHDESAYAVKALSWLDESPDTGWSLHRAPALSVYAYAVLGLGGDEPWLRSLGLVSLAGLAAATWWLGSRMFDRRAGALASLVVLASPSMLRRATEFLTDIPSAALLVVVMALVWQEFERRGDGPGYGLLWALPVAWAAFYVRYQSILALGLIGLTMLLLWWPRIRSKPGPVLAFAGLGLAGLVPHAVHATVETGSPIGILTFTSDVAGRRYLGEGLVDYAVLLGWPLAGLLGLPLVVFFLWWLVSSWRDGAGRRAGLFLAVPAIGQVVALGLVSHGEARFVFFPLALIAVGAVAGALKVSEAWTASVRRGVRFALLTLLMGSIALSVASARRTIENRILSEQPVQLSAEVVRDRSGSRDCGVLTSYEPQVTFYSGCHSDDFRGIDDADAVIELLPGEVRFMILIEGGKRQPAGETLDGLVAETTGEEIAVDGDRVDAVVFEFTPR